ncbi:calmodulin [Brachionus plicatilis]|uniref:Calmodulin n=1 Tax=Brachionus plicatilis TaxID=10195 RepID=A0A3M7RQP2_BRAPC|nr:calmodulin [Brachionus plicatilis]
MANFAAQSLRAAASLVTASKPEVESFTAMEQYTKNAVLKLKNSNMTEKNELKKLNAQLHNYLENVRALEALNKHLISEVDRAKGFHFPTLANKNSADQEVQRVRVKLETESYDCVKHQTRILESEGLINELNQRIKFFQTESEAQRQKIGALQNQLDAFKEQRESLVRSALVAEDDIAREQGKHLKAEKDLDNLRSSLKDNRLKNKGLEFEIQTLLDELSFRKAVYNEEITELRSKPEGTILNPVDLSNFYKNELITAVKQIRSDFKHLSEQQIKDYKEHKENELSVVVQAAEYEKVMAERAKSKLEASIDLEHFNVSELHSSLNSSKSEISVVNQRNNDLVKRLSSLENGLMDIKLKNKEKLERLQNEIDKLILENDSYANDIEYWDTVTRTKLESEIQTYRSILNCQIKLMQNSNLSYETYLNKTSTTTASSTESESINILRQVFNYFDADKSGTINVSEIDRILERLNVRLSRDAYQKLMRQVDRNGSRDLDFNEFCRLMLPVFTGKFDDDDLWYAFKKFDLDGSGYITVGELKKILANIGQHFSEYEIETMIRKVDSNFDGKLSYQEFCRLMKSPAFK